MPTNHNKQISFKYATCHFLSQAWCTHTSLGTDEQASFWLSLCVWLLPAWIWWTRCCWLRRRDAERATGGKEVTLTSFSLTANEQRVRENRQPACCHGCRGCATVACLFTGWRGSRCPVAAFSDKLDLRHIGAFTRLRSAISASETIPHSLNTKLNLQTS